MAVGAFSCSATSHHAQVLRRQLIQKPRTRNLDEIVGFLPMRRRCHGPMHFSSQRVSTDPKRLIHKPKVVLLRAKSSSSSDNINSEPHKNLSTKDEKNWMSVLLEYMADDFSKSYTETWIVPRNFLTILQVILLYFALRHLLHLKLGPLFADFYTITDSLQRISYGLTLLAVLSLSLYRFRPLPAGWFNYSLKGSWMLDVFVGCLILSLIYCSPSLSLGRFFPATTPSTYFESLHKAIMCRDYPAIVVELLDAVFWTPIWEEIAFRGFLIPSLTRYMSLHWSIVLSAALFSAWHRYPSAMLLAAIIGLLNGLVFARYRNLLPATLLHIFWNMMCSVSRVRYWTGLYW